MHVRLLQHLIDSTIVASDWRDRNTCVNPCSQPGANISRWIHFTFQRKKVGGQDIAIAWIVQIQTTFLIYNGHLGRYETHSRVQCRTTDPKKDVGIKYLGILYSNHLQSRVDQMKEEKLSFSIHWLTVQINESLLYFVGSTTSCIGD